MNMNTARPMMIGEKIWLARRLTAMPPRQRLAVVNHLCTLVDICESYPRMKELVEVACADTGRPVLLTGEDDNPARRERTPEQERNFRALWNECAKVTQHADLWPHIVDDFCDDTEAPERFLEEGADLYSPTFYQELRA